MVCARLRHFHCFQTRLALPTTPGHCNTTPLSHLLPRSGGRWRWQRVDRHPCSLQRGASGGPTLLPPCLFALDPASSHTEPWYLHSPVLAFVVVEILLTLGCSLRTAHFVVFHAMEKLVEGWGTFEQMGLWLWLATTSLPTAFKWGCGCGSHVRHRPPHCCTPVPSAAVHAQVAAHGLLFQHPCGA
jgi:hypothetical protein